MLLRILRLVFIIVCGLTLSACYHPDIQQGNDLPVVQNQQVKLGMSQEDVITLLGQPVLQNTFDNNQLTYVYTDYPNHGDITEHKLLLYFKDDKLVKIERS